MSGELIANPSKAPLALAELSLAEAAVADDSSARKEAAAMAAGTLEEVSEKNEHGRSEKLRNHVHCAFVAAIWIIFILFCIGLLAVGWHYLAPKEWAWLKDDQLSAIKAFIVSSFVTQAAGGYLTKRLG